MQNHVLCCIVLSSLTRFQTCIAFCETKKGDVWQHVCDLTLGHHSLLLHAMNILPNIFHSTQKKVSHFI